MPGTYTLGVQCTRNQTDSDVTFVQTYSSADVNCADVALCPAPMF